MAATAHRQALRNLPYGQCRVGPPARRQRDLRRIALAPVQPARPEPRPTRAFFPDDLFRPRSIDEQLAQRRFRAGMTQEYRDWRAMVRGNPEGLKAAGFEDDPSRGDKEELRLELELPSWAPGRSMKPPRPAIMILPTPVVQEGGASETTG